MRKQKNIRIDSYIQQTFLDLVLKEEYLLQAHKLGRQFQIICTQNTQLMAENEKNFISKLIQYQKIMRKETIQITLQLTQSKYLINSNGNNTVAQLHKLNKNGSFKDRERFCFQITQPRLFLQNSKYIHRVIRPENFIKVGDVFNQLALVQKPSQVKTMKFITQIYLTQEMIQRSNKQKEKIDIWSLACVFYEILTASQLFDGQTPSMYNNKFQIMKNIQLQGLKGNIEQKLIKIQKGFNKFEIHQCSIGKLTFILYVKKLF